MIKALLKPFKWALKALISLVKYIVNIPVAIVKFVVKVVKAIVQEFVKVVTSFAVGIYNLIAYVLKKLCKLAKFIWAWLVEAFVETLNQLWTLLGMFAAWLVLEGSAKTIVGYAIILVLALWLITIRIRNEEE